MRTLVVLLALATVARAQPLPSPDDEIARRHYTAGLARYEQADYAAALVELEAARRVRPVPELDYNIARCHDRLEHVADAIAGYERYLTARPTGADAADVRARVATLRARLALDPPPVRERPRGWWIAPTAVAATAVALGVAGAALVGSVKPDYDDLRAGACARGCTSDVYAGLEARANAGYALLGVAGAAAFTDLVLWVVSSRRRR